MGSIVRHMYIYGLSDPIYESEKCQAWIPITLQQPGERNANPNTQHMEAVVHWLWKEERCVSGRSKNKLVVRAVWRLKFWRNAALWVADARGYVYGSNKLSASPCLRCTARQHTHEYYVLVWQRVIKTERGQQEIEIGRLYGTTLSLTPLCFHFFLVTKEPRKTAEQSGHRDKRRKESDREREG